MSEVLDGLSVTEVAIRYGVTRQTIHTWLRRYGEGGIGALADKSSKPESCPHQMAPLTEARVISLRREHPRWGPRSIRTRLANEGFVPVPGLSSIYRTLVRHHLLEPGYRRVRRPNGFVYVDQLGRRLRDPETLSRIRKLAIPPAWESVWICPVANGHIQARGRDARGRTQYRYEARWRELRSETKFHKMVAFSRPRTGLSVSTSNLARRTLKKPLR